jgi:hypothetical protein
MPPTQLSETVAISNLFYLFQLLSVFIQSLELGTKLSDKLCPKTHKGVSTESKLLTFMGKCETCAKRAQTNFFTNFQGSLDELKDLVALKDLSDLYTHNATVFSWLSSKLLEISCKKYGPENETLVSTIAALCSLARWAYYVASVSIGDTLNSGKIDAVKAQLGSHKIDFENQLKTDMAMSISTKSICDPGEVTELPDVLKPIVERLTKEACNEALKKLRSEGSGEIAKQRGKTPQHRGKNPS